MKLVNWVLAVSLWFARLVEVVLLRGLSFWAYIVGLGCIFLVVSSHWVALTISNEISGLHASILGYVPSHPGNPLLSWGFAAGLLFALAAWTYSHKQWRTLALVGAALLVMCFAGLLQLAFAEPVLLKKLADEELQWVGVQRFQNRFLPTCLRGEESNSVGPNITASIETAWDRTVAARYFMGSGWYLGIAVGLLSFFYAKARLSSPPERSRLTKGTLVVAACLAIAFSSRAVVAQILVTWGQDAEARGDPVLAIQRYRKAMSLDGWFAIHPTLYQRIGAIDANFGRVDTLEYGIFYSELLFAQGNYSEAIAELETAIPKAGKLATILREREAKMWTDYGLALYKQRAIAAGIPAWQEALAKNPSQWLAGFCLSRAYFTAGRYQESASLSERMIKAVRDPALIAEMYSNLGDADTRLGNLGEAHVAYRKSYLIDYVYNWRGLSDMIGAQTNISLEDSDQVVRK
jgi:tetratricopeptide (TPR) repeat protein